MFHSTARDARSSGFTPNYSAIERRIRALESELERLGRATGKRTSAGISAAGDQIGDAIASAVSDVVDRVRSGRQVVGEEAARFSNEAAKFGARVGNDALDRISSEVETRPLVMLGVAIGIGILIGMASRRH